MNKTVIVACFAAMLPMAYADQGALLNSGGSLVGGSAVSNPPGILTISGKTLSFLSTDGSTAVNATFTTSSTEGKLLGRRQGRQREVQFHLHWNLQRQAERQRIATSD